MTDENVAPQEQPPEIKEKRVMDRNSDAYKNRVEFMRKAREERKRLKDEREAEEQKKKRIVVDPEAVNAALSSTITPFTPSQKQLDFARAILEDDTGASITKLTKKARATRPEVQQWYADAGFRTWMGELRIRLFNASTPIIDKKLIELASEGSFKHMELFYQLKGDLAKTLEERTAIIPTSTMSVSERYALFTQKLTQLTGRLTEEKKSQPIEIKEEPVDAEPATDTAQPESK